MRSTAIIGALFATGLGLGTATAQNPVQLTWQGEVTAPVMLRIQGDRVDFDNRYVINAGGRFNSPLPQARGARVDFNVREGRGQVRMVEQPRPSNNYTAVVSVNPRGRRDMFVIDFMWAGGDYGSVFGNDRYSRRDDAYYQDDQDYRRDRRYRDRTYRDDEGYRSRSSDAYGYNNNTYGANGYRGGNNLVFSGRIDGRVRVIVQGGRYWLQTMSGRPASDVRVDFGSPLPSQPMNVQLNRAQGRDGVHVIEQPSAQNGYRLIFEINDSSGGDDLYTVEARW